MFSFKSGHAVWVRDFMAYKNRLTHSVTLKFQLHTTVGVDKKVTFVIGNYILVTDTVYHNYNIKYTRNTTVL